MNVIIIIIISISISISISSSSSSSIAYSGGSVFILATDCSFYRVIAVACKLV